MIDLAATHQIAAAELRDQRHDLLAVLREGCGVLHINVGD